MTLSPPVFIIKNDVTKEKHRIMSISMIGIDHDRAPVDIRAPVRFYEKKRGRGYGKNEKNSRDLRLCHSFHLQPPGDMGKP